MILLPITANYFFFSPQIQNKAFTIKKNPLLLHDGITRGGPGGENAAQPLLLSELRWGFFSFSLNKSSPKWTVKKDLLLQCQHLSERFPPRETLGTHGSSPLLHLYLLLSTYSLLFVSVPHWLCGATSPTQIGRTSLFLFFPFFNVPHESSPPRHHSQPSRP